MEKTGDTEIEFTESEELRLLTEKHEQQLKKIQQQLDEMSNKLDSLVQKIEHASINSKFGILEKITPKLDKAVHSFVLLFIVIIVFSAITLAFLSARIAELMAQISLLCIVLAIIIEIIYLVIDKAKLFGSTTLKEIKNNE